LIYDPPPRFEPVGIAFAGKRYVLSLWDWYRDSVDDGEVMGSEEEEDEEEDEVLMNAWLDVREYAVVGPYDEFCIETYDAATGEYISDCCSDWARSQYYCPSELCIEPFAITDLGNVAGGQRVTAVAGPVGAELIITWIPSLGTGCWSRPNNVGVALVACMVQLPAIVLRCEADGGVRPIAEYRVDHMKFELL
jgi:hypothetical protein